MTHRLTLFEDPQKNRMGSLNFNPDEDILSTFGVDDRYSLNACTRWSSTHTTVPVPKDEGNMIISWIIPSKRPGAASPFQYRTSGELVCHIC